MRHRSSYNFQDQNEPNNICGHKNNIVKRMNFISREKGQKDIKVTSSMIYWEIFLVSIKIICDSFRVSPHLISVSNEQFE